MINILNDGIILHIIKNLDFIGSMKLIRSNIEFLYYYNSLHLLKLYLIFLNPYLSAFYLENADYINLECIIDRIIRYETATHKYTIKINHPVEGETITLYEEKFNYQIEKNTMFYSSHCEKNDKNNIFQMFCYYLRKLLIFEEEDRAEKDKIFYSRVKPDESDNCQCYCGFHLKKKNLKKHFNTKIHDINYNKKYNNSNGKKKIIKVLNNFINSNILFNFGISDDRR